MALRKTFELVLSETTNIAPDASRQSCVPWDFHFPRKCITLMGSPGFSLSKLRRVANRRLTGRPESNCHDFVCRRQMLQRSKKHTQRGLEGDYCGLLAMGVTHVGARRQCLWGCAGYTWFMPPPTSQVCEPMAAPTKLHAISRGGQLMASSNWNTLCNLYCGGLPFLTVLFSRVCWYLEFDVCGSNGRQNSNFLYQEEISQQSRAVQPAEHQRHADEQKKSKPPPDCGDESVVCRGSGGSNSEPTALNRP